MKVFVAGDRNIFSTFTSEADTEIRRKEMADQIGSDAEELAFRLMYVTGLAGYYNFDQSPANPYRDDLASLYRPNDAWQGFREANTTEPGPIQIVGMKEYRTDQYFRSYSFLQPYPMYIGDVILRDGTVMDCFEALKSGKFSDVMWNEIKTGYGLFEYHVNIARKFKATLVQPSNEERLKEENMRGLRDLTEKVLDQQRDVIDTEIVQESTAGGVTYNRRKYKRARGNDDRWTQSALFNFYRSVIAQHNPSNQEISVKEMWEYSKARRLFENLKISGVMRPDNIERLRGQADLVTWQVMSQTRTLARSE
jgi:hypothetical protein